MGAEVVFNLACFFFCSRFTPPGAYLRMTHLRKHQVYFYKDPVLPHSSAPKLGIFGTRPVVGETQPVVFINPLFLNIPGLLTSNWTTTGENHAIVIWGRVEAAGGRVQLDNKRTISHPQLIASARQLVQPIHLLDCDFRMRSRNNKVSQSGIEPGP